MKKSMGFAIVLALALAGTAAAHYTFIMPEKFRATPGEQLTIAYHAADGFPESTQLPRRLQNALLHNAGAQTAIAELRDDGTRRIASVKVPAGYSILTAVNPSATTEMSPASFLDYLKEENLTEVIAMREKLGEAARPGRERYTMYMKSLVLAGPPNNSYKAAAGLPFEIVPEKDPFQLRSGESLPVQVLLKGAPVGNLHIMAATVGVPARNVGNTDSNGRISIPVTSGPWRLHTIHMERVNEPTVDWESYWATLTFEIP